MEEMAKLFSTVIYRVVGVDKGKSASGFVGSRTRVAAQDYGSNLSFKKLNAASPLAVENRALVGPLTTDSFERNPFAASSAVEIVWCVAVTRTSAGSTPSDLTRTFPFTSTISDTRSIPVSNTHVWGKYPRTNRPASPVRVGLSCASISGTSLDKRPAIQVTVDQYVDRSPFRTH